MFRIVTGGSFAVLDRHLCLFSFSTTTKKHDMHVFTVALVLFWNEKEHGGHAQRGIFGSVEAVRLRFAAAWTKHTATQHGY